MEDTWQKASINSINKGDTVRIGGNSPEHPSYEGMYLGFGKVRVRWEHVYEDAGPAWWSCSKTIALRGSEVIWRQYR
jgi:hypothetical protein